MRIALVSTQWPGVRLGGIGVYTVHCARALAGVGHEVHIVTLPLPADARRGVPEGVVRGGGGGVHEVDVTGRSAELPAGLPLGGRAVFNFNAASWLGARVRQLHQEMHLDVVEAPEYEGLGLCMALGDVPLVTHLHSGSAITRAANEAEGSEVDPEEALVEAMELEAMAGADGLCAPSQCVVDETRRAYGAGTAGVADLQAEVIPLPFDPPGGEEGTFELAAVDAPLLYVGRLEYLKGAHVLAEAAGAFLRAHPRARLRIVGPDTMTAPVAGAGGGAGKTSMREWMVRQIPAEVAERVAFVGEATREEVTREMRGCAAVVLPSLRESYSYVSCEALGAGRPVVVSSGIGAVEVAGEAGVVFERGNAAALAEAMGRMWTDAGMREHLSRVGWERARTALASAQTIRQRVAFYERVIERRKREGTREVERRLAALPRSIRGGAGLAEALAGLRTPGMRVVERLTGLGRGGVRFYLYGAGRHTGRLLMEQERWEAAGHRLVGLIDDHPRFKEEPQCFGLPVVACAVAEGLGAETVVVLSTDAFEEQFWKNTEGLRRRGMAVVKLYSEYSE